MPTIACVNGRFLPLSRAMVSVEDRGFQFGDGVYEVVRGYGGKLFRLDAHLDRLVHSARAIRLSMRYSLPQWRRLIVRAYQMSGFPDAKVYLQLTRGGAPREHAFPAAVRPTVVITVRKLQALDPELRRNGVSAITVPDLRWGRCDVKSLNLLANVLAREDAREAGVFEAILVREGSVTEGAISNVFAVIHGTVTTPPTDPSILPGITRAATLDLVRAEGLPLAARSFSVQELHAAEEVFLTGTTMEIVPVVSINGAKIGTGAPGPVTQVLARSLSAMVEAECGSGASGVSSSAKRRRKHSR